MTAQLLLHADTDPDPVAILNPDSSSPVLLVCEHAGRHIPAALGDMGLPEGALNLHIAYDLGAELLATTLADRLGCTLILQRYSRLVIDCNRPPGTATSIPDRSDGIAIPANQSLPIDARRQREAAIFEPYANACLSVASRSSLRLALSIHSFTPAMAGIARPWDIGFLYRSPGSRGDELSRATRTRWPELTVGDNEPYCIEDDSDWFIPVCAEPTELAHSLIEVRNDHLQSAENCTRWATRLEQLIADFLEG